MRTVVAAVWVYEDNQQHEAIVMERHILDFQDAHLSRIRVEHISDLGKAAVEDGK
jgi:hypothetical protein